MNNLTRILPFILLFLSINPALALNLSDKHKQALKIECKQALEEGLFLSKNKCYFEKTELLDQYGYAWTDKLGDKDLARIVQLKCHILIDDGIFKYNQCIEKRVNLALGIVKEPPLQPPLEYVPDESIDTDKESDIKNSDESKIKIVESKDSNIQEIYERLKKSVLFVITTEAKIDFTDSELEEADWGTCSAVSIGENLFATNAHCVLFGKEKKMSQQQISDFICMLPVTEEISAKSKCNWATVRFIDAYRDQAIVSIIKDDNGETNFTAPAVKVKESNKVNIFDPIYTLGNPKGTPAVFSDGKITAIRETSTVGGLMEKPAKIYTIDAMIEGGSSGGGLFDINGNLIGITSAGDTSRMGKKDMTQFNFAIAIDEFLNLID
tara:strand:- start:189 stop:1331 length:1143 start_codon:yes stop_codon:yes gene_type:complete